MASGLLAAVWTRLQEAPFRVRAFWAAALALAAHMSALRGGLVWLDHAHLEERLALAPRGELTELFRQPFAGTGFYRPFVALSLSLDALAGSTALFHLTNLLWHAAAAVLVVLAGEAFGLSRRAATVGGLLFAAHPLGSLVAGAIAFRSESMITVGLLGLLVAHLRRRPLWAAAALLLAALSKETGLALGPLFVIVLEAHRAKRGRAERHVLAAEGAALAVAGGLRAVFAPEWLARFPELSRSEAVGTRLATLAKSAASFALPIDRSICDAFPVSPVAAPAALLGAALAAGTVALALSRGKLGVLLALSLLPSLQLVPTLRFWSPHYLYVPLAFAALLVAETLERRGRLALGLALPVTVALGVLSFRDGRRYRSDETLFAPEAAREPACREAQFYLGEVHRRKREWSAAAGRYELALAGKPGVLAFVDLDATLQNLGLVRFEQGDLRAAAAAFSAALDETRSETSKRRLRHDLAVVALTLGDARRAVGLLEPEIARSDALPESLLVAADALRVLGRDAEAEALLGRHAAARPKTP